MSGTLGYFTAVHETYASTAYLAAHVKWLLAFKPDGDASRLTTNNPTTRRLLDATSH